MVMYKASRDMLGWLNKKMQETELYKIINIIKTSWGWAGPSSAQAGAEAATLVQMGVNVRFDNLFGVYLCSWTTIILYVSLNFNFWFNLILGLFNTFWGPYGLFFGVAVGFKCSWNTFIFYDSFNSDFWLWPDFWVVSDFLRP